MVVVLLLRTPFERESPTSEAFKPQSPEAPQLQDCAEADAALEVVMRSILENREEKHHRGGVRSSEIEALSSVTHEHPGTKSAMRAKFLIGTIYFFRGSKAEVAKAKPYLETIIQEYPDTFESKHANYCLQSMAYRNLKDKKGEVRQKHNAEARKALNGLIPYATQLDQDSSDYATFFKNTTMGREGRKLTPALLSELSLLFEWDDKEEEAERVLRQIVEEHPETHWSEKAKRDLKSINASGNGH